MEEEEFLSLDEVEKSVKLSKSTIRRRIKAELFPKPVYFSPRKPKWSKQSIEKWKLKTHKGSLEVHRGSQKFIEVHKDSLEVHRGSQRFTESQIGLMHDLLNMIENIKGILVKIEKNTRNEVKNNETKNSKGKKLFDLWNQRAPKQLPKAERFNTKRQKTANARLKENPDLDYWMRGIDKICHSDFLMGKNARGWRANFDWLIAPGNIEKLTEGQYEPNKGQSVEDMIGGLED